MQHDPMIDTASQWYYRRRQIVGYNYVIMEVTNPMVIKTRCLPAVYYSFVACPLKYIWH